VFDATERRKTMEYPCYVSIPRPSHERWGEARQRKTLSELEQAQVELLAKAEEKIIELEKIRRIWNQAVKLPSGEPAAAVTTLSASHTPQSRCLNVNFNSRVYRLVFEMVGEKTTDYYECYLRTHVERCVEKYFTNEVLVMDAGERWKVLNGQRYLDKLGNVCRDSKGERVAREPDMDLIDHLVEAILTDVAVDIA
jgi:hypothetical protein